VLERNASATLRDRFALIKRKGKGKGGKSVRGERSRCSYIQLSRGCISRCDASGHRTFNNRRRIASRQKDPASAKRQFTRGAMTRVRFCCCHCRAAYTSVRPQDRSGKGRGGASRRRRERRNPVSEAEGREAEKRNDDETRSHYYIHIQARWGEPSPSFRVLRPPLGLSRRDSLSLPRAAARRETV